MAVISGGDGGNSIIGTNADDVIYGHSVADLGPNVGQIVATAVATGFSSPVYATSSVRRRGAACKSLTAARP